MYLVDNIKSTMVLQRTPKWCHFKYVS